MKNRFILLLTSALLATTSIGATIAKSELKSFKCGPLHTDGSETIIEISVLVRAAKNLRLSIYLINDLYPKGAVIGNLLFRTNAEKVISYNNEYTRPNNTLRVDWQIDGSKIIESKTLNVDVYNGDVIRLNSPIYKYRSQGKIASYDSEDGIDYDWQVLNFYNFQDRYVPDYYHKIDLSNFYIENLSSYQKTLKCKSAYLSITNINNTFAKFGNVKIIQIPLKLVNEENKVHLTFETSLFVNPRTLVMSPTSDDGFVKTNHFYLPRGLKRTEETYDCQVRINQLGADHSDFVANFRYKSLLNTFGDCRSSEFCIVNH